MKLYKKCALANFRLCFPTIYQKSEHLAFYKSLYRFYFTVVKMCCQDNFIIKIYWIVIVNITV